MRAALANSHTLADHYGIATCLALLSPDVALKDLANPHRDQAGGRAAPIFDDAQFGTL